MRKRVFRGAGGGDFFDDRFSMTDPSREVSALPISQEAALELLEAAKEALILLRELRWSSGDIAQGDRQIAMLVEAITKAEAG